MSRRVFELELKNCCRPEVTQHAEHEEVLCRKVGERCKSDGGDARSVESAPEVEGGEDREGRES